MERYKGFLRLRYVCDVPRQTIRAERHENAKLLLKVVRKQREGQGKELGTRYNLQDYDSSNFCHLPVTTSNYKPITSQ